MADVNKLLPDVGGIDTSITINDDMSLEKIANQYGGLGNDINRLGNAAAEDVHQRQVKLIGNDFGPVNPMMYGAYYQPSINETESEMRVQGTQKALEEGMDRGKKAAEANLANAKASYQQSIDAYNNAKQAFSQAQVAILPNIDTGTWENVTGANAQSFKDFINDPEKAKNDAITKYTDQIAASRDSANFWNSKGAWDIAKNNVRQATGKNITDDEFRNNREYGQAVTKAYIEEYFSSRGETKNLERFRSSYDYMKKAVNDVANYISGVIENPEFLVNKQAIREGKTIEGYDNDFIKDFWSGTEFNNIFGFSVMDMHELVRWKNENPQQFKEYNEQLAQATGVSQTTEIADGERWYLMPDGQYKQLQKGTPVFFAYPGSMNSDGTYNDKSLEKFIKMYRDFYKTDVTKISDEELSQRQEALNEAYKDYMQHVAGVIRFEQSFDRVVDADMYNTVLACFDNVATSQQMIYGHTAQEWVASFKEGIQKNSRTAAAYFQELAAVAYEHNPDIFRYNPSLKQIVTESMYYDEDSVAPNENKLASRAFEDQAIREAVRKLPPERATAEFLLYSRSMELYNDGATNDNINPSFLNNKLRDFSNQVFKDLYSNFITVPASLINFGVGTIGGFLTQGSSNGLEFDMFNNNMSMKDVWGGLIDPSYGTEGHPNSILGKAMIYGDLDSNAKKYAMSLVNPLFVDIITGDKEWNELTGIAQQYSSESPDFFSKTNLEYMGMRMASLIMSGYAQGAAIKGVGAAGKAIMTSKMADRVRLAAMPHIVNWTSNSTIASKLSVIPEQIVSVENGQQAIRGATLAVYADDPLMVAQAEAKRLATKATNATAELTALNATNKVDDIVSDIKKAGGRTAKGAEKLDDVYGVLTRNAVHGLTSMSAENIDDLIKNYSSLIEQSKASSEAYKAAAEAVPRVTLKSGEVVSLADATLVTQANRVLGVSTLNMMTGISSIELARLPDEYRNLLMKVANRMTATSDATNYSSGLRAFLKTLTPDDFKSFAQETLKRAAINADLGRGFEKLDLLRIAAAVGWEKSGVKALAREFLKDALTDPFRDLYMNVRNPEFTMEGNYHVQTLGEYFTDPYNLAFNLGFSTGHFALNRIKNQVGGSLYSRWSEQARAALNATGERTAEEAKKAYQRAFDMQNKAQQFADNAWKAGMNYNKAQNLVANSNVMVKQSIDQIFKANGIDVRYGGDDLHLDNKEAFIDYINNKKLAPQEGLYILANGLNLTATNNYFMNKLAVGTGVGEFGNLDQNTYLKVYRTAIKSASKYNEVVRSTDKDAIKKINKVYDHMKADMLKANNSGEYGPKIRNFEKSLTYIFDNLKTAAKTGLEDGTLENVRLGYLPIGSLTYSGSYDDMVNSHTLAPSRGLAYEGGVINVSALNPSEARDVLQFEDIISAMEKGEKTIEVNGEERQLDYAGLNPLDMLSVYQNNYNVHKYLDPLVGDSRLKFGEAALKNYNAYIVATADEIAKARNIDIKHAREKITGYDYKDENGEKHHVRGWNEKIVDAAKAKGDDISDAIKTTKKSKVVEKPLTNDVKEKATKASTKLTETRAKKLNAQKIVADGGISDSGYAFVGKLFGYTVNGKGDPKEGARLFKNGQQIASKLMEAYSKGEINENNYKDGFKIDAQFKGKLYKKNLVIDSDTFQAIKNAYELGTPDADISIRAAILSDLATPFNPETNKTVKGYTSTLRNLEASQGAPKDAPRVYEVSSAGDKNFSAYYARFKKGTTIEIDGKSFDIGGMTVENAYQKVLKKSGKGLPPAKDSPLYVDNTLQKGSQSLTEGVSGIKTYQGLAKNDGNTIFVFGSNPEGRHGAGAAKTAKDQFGAIYGQGEGLQGNSYALPTKDLRVKENNSLRSISPEQITKNISKMYDVAREHPDKQFKVASYASDKNLNGYTAEEMAKMFLNAGDIPENVFFSEPMAKIMGDVKSNVSSYTRNQELPLKKVISGAQTGADTVGLEIANKLGYETGGTAAPDYYREKGFDKHDADSLVKLGVKEISSNLQSKAVSRSQFYLPRTEQNVIDSDGTVYFNDNSDSAGYAATKRFATKHQKPMIVNPTADELKKWITDNNIQTLNIAGNRGSKFSAIEKRMKETLVNGLSKEGGFEFTSGEELSYNKGYLPLWRIWADQNPEKIKTLSELSQGLPLNDRFAKTGVNQARALTDILVEKGFREKGKSEKGIVRTSGKNGEQITTNVNDANETISNKLLPTLSSPKARQEFINTMTTMYKTNEYGVVTSSESRYKALQDFTEDQTYKGLGTTAKDAGAQEKRITESLIDRARTELSSYKEGFDGYDMFQKLDAIAPDKDILNTLMGRKMSNDQNVLAVLKGLDEDGAIDMFIDQLDKFKTEVAAGKYDDIIPEGMDKKALYGKVQDAYEIMAWATEYNNKPTAMEEAPVRFGEDGEELDIDEAGDYGTTDITGAAEVESMTGRFSVTELDLDKTNMNRRATSLGDILDIYTNKENPLYKYIHTDEMDKLRDGRLDASNATKELYKEVVKRGKQLYDSGKSVAYKKAVDDATENITNRVKASGNEPTDEQLENAYAEALGIAAPNTRLNQVVSGSDYTSRNYNAAKMAEANGVVDATASSGWNEKVNKMRLEAGTYGGYAQQIAEGIKNLITFAGSDKDYADLMDKATDTYLSMDSVLSTKRSDALDNFENSLIAMIGDVYDPKAMVKQLNGPDMLNYGTRIKRSFTSTIETGLYGEPISDKVVFEGFANTNQKLIGSYPMVDNMDDFKMYAELFTASAERNMAKPGAERDDATFRYLTVLGEAYRNYLAKKPAASREMTKTEFMHNLEGTFEGFVDTLQAHAEFRHDFDNTVNRIPTPSQERGKASLYNEGILNFIGSSKVENVSIKDNLSIDVNGKKYRLEADYGTGNEYSQTGVGFTLYDEEGSQHDLGKTFASAEDKDAVAKSINEMLEENDESYRIIPISEEGNPKYGNTLQNLSDGWVVAELKNDFVGFDTDARELLNTARNGGYEKNASDIMTDALFNYAEATKNDSPAKKVSDAKKAVTKAEASEKAVDKQMDSVKKEATAGAKTMDAYAKKYLTRSEYNQYRADVEAYKEIRAKKADDNDYYRSKVGEYALINGGEIPKGHVTLGSILALLGYDKKNFNSDISEGRKYTPEELAADKKAHKAMQKKVNENLRKGNAVYKNVEQFKIPGELDLKSKTMTINNLLAFASQAQKKSGFKTLDPENIVISKEYADLLFRVSREGINGDSMMSKLKTTAFRITDWNKFIQDFQLAGGVSYVNALTIAQIRGAIFSSPLRAAQYIKLATDFKDDAAVAKFAIENSERLVQIAMKTGDTTILTDFQSSASSRPGYSDGGTVSSFIANVIDANKNRKATERTGDEKYDFYRDSINNAKDALFGDATFKRTLPVLRAKMMIMNYDQAYKMLQKKFTNITTDELEDAASKFAYAKTTAFFEPNKTQSGFFRSKGINEMLDKVQTQTQRDLLASWIGAKDDISIGQMAGNCFFALGYKNRMIQSILQGVRSIISPAELVQRRNIRGTFDDAAGTIKLGMNETLGDMGTQFMQSGNRQQIRTIVFLAATAFISAKALGLATAWDDLNFEDETQTDENGNPQFKIPDILTKFQTIGQIWIPNAIDQEGRLYVDPKKKAFKLDTLSSIFTLPNTAWKTIDRITDPEAYYSAPQRGLPFLGVNNPINQFINADIPRAIGDELIGSNLLSPYKAMYEVLVDSTYYGNNIWEKKYLKDGSVNKNYDPARNVKASIFHILGFDDLLSPRGYNDYVKGYYDNPNYKTQDQLGTITGSGIFQHEYITALVNFMKDDMWGGLVEAGEIPVKSQRLSSTARTELNTKVKNAIAQYMADYKDAIGSTTDVDLKDREYAKAAKRSADTLQAWSKKYSYVLGKDQSLLPYATKMMMSILAGEYDDNLDYVQNTYWKASQIAQIEATGAAGYWLDDNDFDAWIADGKSPEDFAAEKNKRSEAYNQALDAEYKARKALHDAGVDSEYLAGMSLENLRAEQRKINRVVYSGAMNAMNSPIGEFKNFKEMKKYYEAQIDAAGSTKQKAKLAEQYNKYVTDALAPYIDKYGEGIIADGYYNNEYLSNALADFIIIPADKYYSGKTPRASYLKDLFGVGFRNESNLPSDKEVIAGYEQARREMQKGYVASSAAILDSMIESIKKGRLYVSDRDYSKIVKMKAYLSSKSN